ncbi:MAG: hypothetical protein H0X02_11355, partial [Nitrosomonas sp.]|nr:hypothetical protein [Nitrosomonas sp.]
MRRTEYLVTELRNSTDNSEANGVKDAEVIAYLNYAQKLIQNIIFRVNPKADIFKKIADYSYDSAGEYALPSDIFAKNAISSVEYKIGDEYNSMAGKDKSEYGPGYYVEDSLVHVVGYENLDIRITCFRSLPRMDKRWGRVASLIAGTSITLTGNDANAST